MMNDRHFCKINDLLDQWGKQIVYFLSKLLSNSSHHYYIKYLKL